VQEGLAAADAHALKEPFPDFKEREGLIFRNGDACLAVEDEIGVVAVAAAEVASREKERTGDLPRIVHQRGLLDSPELKHPFLAYDQTVP